MIDITLTVFVILMAASPAIYLLTVSQSGSERSVAFGLLVLCLVGMLGVKGAPIVGYDIEKVAKQFYAEEDYLK